MIIIAGAIILSLSNGNVIAKAKEARARSNLSGLKDQFDMAYSSAFGNNIGVNPTKTNIEAQIGTLPSGYLATDRGLVYNSTDESIITYAPNYDISVIAKGVNFPKLTTGMTPITFDGSETPVVTSVAGIATSTWFNYVSQGTRLTDGKTSMWANVKLLDGSQFVWIPRYAYKITYYTTSALTITSPTKTAYGSIDVRFLAGTSNYEIVSNTAIGTDLVGAGSLTGYIVHPAFTADIAAGGWDKELTGIWVAKYEAGFDSTYEVSSVNGYRYPVFKPSQYSYNVINTGDAYSLSRVLNAAGNPYGLTADANSHLMKNSEWGVTAYLAHSQYGRNATEVRINNYNLNGTSGFWGVTGVGATTSNASENIPTDKSLAGIPSDNKYSGQYGVLASTTGNLYGIYDMSGGNWEKTTDYISNPVGQDNLAIYGSSLLTETGSTKYKSIYAYNVGDTKVLNYSQSPNTTRVGEAIWETSISGTDYNSWMLDSSNFVSGFGPFLMRGGAYNFTSAAGIFSFTSTAGNDLGVYSFRPVLVV